MRDLEVLHVFPAPHGLSNAEALLIQLFTYGGHRTLQFLGEKEFYSWDAGIWARVPESRIQSVVASELSKGVKTIKPPAVGENVLQALSEANPIGEKDSRFIATAAKVREVVSGLAMLAETRTIAEEPDNDLIVMANGVFSISKRKIVSPWSPEFPHTWKLDFDYNEKAQCPAFSAYIDSITGNQPNTKKFLQEYLGYVLSGSTKRQTALYLMGASGAGKSVFAEICAEVVGVKNVESASGDIDKWSAAQWENAKLITFPDVRNVGDPRRLGQVILQIVGNDKVTVERKGKDPYTAKIDANVLVVSNVAIPIYDEAGVAITRFKGVYLDKVFRGTKDEDTGLKEKIRAEMSGVFNWALEGLKRLEENGAFTTPDTHDKVISLLRTASSKTAEFYENYLESTGSRADVLDARDIQRAIKHWLGNEKIQRSETSINGINSRLGQYGYDVSRPKDDAGKNFHAVAGIRFAEEYKCFRSDLSIQAERARNQQVRREPSKVPPAKVKPDQAEANTLDDQDCKDQLVMF